MAVFTETIKLDDQVSAAAGKASGAVGLLGKGLDAAKQTLGDTKAFAGSAMTKLGVDTLASANAMTIGKETIGSSIQGIKASLTSLAAGDVTGAVEGATEAVAGMAKMLDLVVPGLGQAASAVISIAGGLVGITAGLIKSGVEFAISSNEAKQQMLGLFDAMGGGVATGAETEAMIDGLKSKFGIAKDSLVGWTNELHRMGMTDLSQIEDSLLATASAAALVKGGDAALMSFTKKIQLAADTGGKLKIPTKALAELSATGANVGDVAKVMGVSVEKLTKDLAAGTVDADAFGDALQDAIINKGVGPLAKLATSSKNLGKLLEESIGDLFEDIDVGPFLAEVKSLFDIFGQGTASGQTLKAGVGGFFKEVLGTLTKVVPMVKHFFLDMIIVGLKAYIAIKPIVAKVKELWASASEAGVLTQIFDSLVNVAQLFGAVLLGAVVVVGVLWAAMIAVSVAVWTAVGAFLGFVEIAGGALTGWVATAATAAYDFVAGLVQGIADGAGMVVSAVTGLAGSATGAFKSALGIASPSKVMQGLGENTGEGVAVGIDDAAPDVHGAASGLATAAVEGVSGGGSGSSSTPPAAAGGGITVFVQIDGAGKSAMEITEEMVSSVFERIALSQGVAA